MDAVPIIARASRGEPLHRVAVDQANGLVYITTPDRVAAVGTGEWDPTGFPKEDIFFFDSGTYKILRAQWEHGGRTDSALWQRLSRYSS